MKLPSRFNIRVYGLIINEHNQVLISDEQHNDFKFSKFPGGGLEFGEGPEDCVKREFLEELNLEVEIVNHFYTTGFYQQSAFNKEHQIISIYYLLNCENWKKIEVVTSPFENIKLQNQVFRWVDLKTLYPDELNFPIDKFVADKLKNSYLLK